MSVKLVVDRDLCDANGVCEEVFPEGLQLGEDDVLELRLKLIPASLEQRAREAARACPKQALKVIEVTRS